ncbi:MAG: hypothetical protein GWM98_23230 [Nitrospinaceae bacterium]|nr:hypothetical protein [Nitrospinaceae bacterium]NIR56837.1 hypothetical protein [Nitrospinaceae bacterium]NIS87304.1 hypothetical protein [Nitrospinaceae bacterium]NIT84157.1 hypothetical protein [Nitrospinaceae bacterium]NIU46344.1 hypothetical protein [Nitrospinaceae bacterium]
MMRWMIVILAVLCSGCVIHSRGRTYVQQPVYQATTFAQVNAMVGVQQPSEYKVGFMAGCDSGRVSAGDTSFTFKKDTPRFEKDDLYRQGWNDGFNRCAAGAPVPASAPAPTVVYNDPYYYPGNYYYYSGFYWPYFYTYPSYSINLGWYGNRHRHHNHYYSPWYGQHRHKGRGQTYLGRNYFKRGGSYLNRSYKGNRGGPSYRGKGNRGKGRWGRGGRGGRGKGRWR